MKIIKQVDLKNLSTIKISSKALGLIIVDSFKEIEKAIDFINREKVNSLFLGKGSNIIPSKEFISCYLIKIKQTNNFIIDNQNNSITIRARGGESLKKLTMLGAKYGFEGIECLAGIPGSVGGAIKMNAGSFGGEIGNFVKEITIWHLDRGILKFKKDEVRFCYRKFLPPIDDSRWCVWDAVFEFNKTSPNYVKTKIKENYKKKKTSQPVLEKSCGCVFKNPKDYPAGYLLEKVGLKGKGIGDMEFSHVHANFLINKKDGAPSHAMELIELAKFKVFKEFGISLDLEVKLI